VESRYVLYLIKLYFMRSLQRCHTEQAQLPMPYYNIHLYNIHRCLYCVHAVEEYEYLGAVPTTHFATFHFALFTFQLYFCSTKKWKWKMKNANWKVKSSPLFIIFLFLHSTVIFFDEKLLNFSLTIDKKWR